MIEGKRSFSSNAPVSGPVQTLHDLTLHITRLTTFPGGTGQLIGRLQDNQIDIAMYVSGREFSSKCLRLIINSALTDPLIAGIAKGSKAYKLVGSYVETPLNW
jgi:hypothetical protein